ncbi:MAG: murein biosynthesis integral membrane protein MurJ [Verrucomicrobia bacterium]|nr:murein biosynthesis integral membrane protein MurJ [Verrucomicrobiota bacterium]
MSSIDTNEMVGSTVSSPAEERALGRGGITRAATVFGLGTAASRVMGLVRDMLAASIFGTSLAWSAFVLAFAIPNLFRRLFAEGALAGAFVPVFTDQLKHEGRESALRLARTVATAVGVVLLGVIVVAWVVFGVLDVVVDTAKVNLIARLGSIVMPYVFFICLAGFGMAVLNSFNHFAVPAFSPVLLNVIFIVALAVFVPVFGGAEQYGIYAVAIAVIVGGVVQLGVQVPVLRRFGFVHRPLLDLRDPAFRRVLALFLPRLVGLAVVQINVVVDYALGYIISDDASSHLAYANRLVQLPLGIFGVAIATAALPALSKLRAAGRMDTFRSTLSYSLRQTLSIAIPASVGLILIRRPLVELIYERGAFSPAASLIVSDVVMFYAFGLFAYATTQILVPAFLALQDAKTPMRISIGTTVLNFCLNMLLGVALGMAARGFALATAISATCNLVLLAVLLRRRLGQIEGRPLLDSIVRIVVASLVMGAWVFAACFLLGRLFEGPSVLIRVLLVVVPTGVGLAAYLVASQVLGSREAREFLHAYRRKTSVREPGDVAGTGDRR